MLLVTHEVLHPRWPSTFSSAFKGRDLPNLKPQVAAQPSGMIQATKRKKQDWNPWNRRKHTSYLRNDYYTEAVATVRRHHRLERFWHGFGIGFPVGRRKGLGCGQLSAWVHAKKIKGVAFRVPDLFIIIRTWKGEGVGFSGSKGALIISTSLSFLFIFRVIPSLTYCLLFGFDTLD